MSGGPPPGGAQALRWVTASASGLLLTRAGRLYYARLATTGAAGSVASCLLKDGVGGPTLLGLASVVGTPDDWPAVPVSINFQHGVEATLTGTALVVLGWEPD